MQELPFRLDGLRWDSLCTSCFHFCHRKSHKFQKTKKLLKDRKNLIYLNSHRYYVSYCLCCPDTSRQTYGMRCLQELFFRLGGLRWGTLQIAFVTEKEHNFQADENIALLNSKRKKKRLIFLNLHRYFVVYCPITSTQK